MSQTLPQVVHEHHERILRQVDLIPATADRLLTATTDDPCRDVHDLSTFFSETLVPHMDAAERTLYPELERMFQNRHSMTPMKREHAEVRRLIEKLGALAGQIGPERLTIGRTLALRRVMFQLYALLKVHLAEEEAYLRIVQHGVTAEAADMLAAAIDHPGVAPA